MTRHDEKAAELLRLHTDPELLILVNVWDVASAQAVAAQDGCRAIATASAAIAASFGYPDGEQIPPEEMFGAIGRIARAVDLPVTADLEAGYGDAGAAIGRAIAAGAVGGNLEDGMRPLADAVAAVRSAVTSAERNGAGFVLNARTDAYLRAGDRDPGDVLTDATERGRAFLDAGAACVFVPGARDADTIAALAGQFGPGRLSILGLPGTPPPSVLAQLGVARVSYGPRPHRHVLGELGDLAASLLSGEPLTPRRETPAPG